MKRELIERARALGFDKARVAAVDARDRSGHFRQWLWAGHAGEMEYLSASAEKRLDIRKFLPGARSVLVVAMNYWTGEPARGGVSCYAWGRPYQDLMMKRLEELKAFVRSRGAKARITVDTGAVLEKQWALAAGLGWSGKHSLQLDAELGSWFTLGVLVTDAELEPDGQADNLCGACTACIDACPTGAIDTPYVVDSRKCISYLTIEKRGEIDDGLKSEMGNWIFGCDVCQQVCPVNANVPSTSEPAFRPVESLKTPDLVALLRAREGEFRGTGVARAKRAGLARNAAIALGNAGRSDAIPALREALKDRDAGVRDAAAWALRRLGTRP